MSMPFFLFCPHKVDNSVCWRNWPTGRLERQVSPIPLLLLPSLHEHGCSYGAPVGFIRRLREGEGTWFAHVWEHCCAKTKTFAGQTVTFRQGPEALTRLAVYGHGVEYEKKRVGLERRRSSLEVANHLFLPEDFWFDPENRMRISNVIEQNSKLYPTSAQRLRWVPVLASLVKAATKNDEHSYMRLNNYSSLIQLGHGRYQKRIQKDDYEREPNYDFCRSCFRLKTRRIRS